MSALRGPGWRVLTLNLHCWQESDAEAKLDRVAQEIARLRPDVVLLQEVGQHVDAPIVGARKAEVIRADNAALLIADTLRHDHGQPHDWAWCFAHIGFDAWEEGVALLTPHRIGAAEGHYVSEPGSRHRWNARRMLIAEVDLGPAQTITCASAHLSWWDDEEEPFAPQFDRADALVRRRMEDAVFAGDFNVRDDGPGYAHMMRNGEWTDAHAVAAAPDHRHGTFPGDIAGWSGAPAGRIDYVLSRGPHLRPRAAQTLFDTTETRVSDHFGLLVDFDLDWHATRSDAEK